VPFFFSFYFFSVLFSIFMETEANYERLRIGGLVFTCLLIIGAVLLLVCNCVRGNRSQKLDETHIKNHIKSLLSVV
uniref:Uncharacterized protein n=1 Tax=Xiphophorus couchianus TaxID=32473 RepID=A0A3B5MF85_9TELE